MTDSPEEKTYETFEELTDSIGFPDLAHVTQLTASLTRLLCDQGVFELSSDLATVSNEVFSELEESAQLFHQLTQVREWTSALRKEGYQLDRQIRAIQREEEKVKRSLKEAAKRGDRDVCTILAKEIVASRKSVTRIHTSKAHINSVQMSMNHQLATLRVAGSLEKSTEVMKSMQNLVKIPEISRTMQELSKEMMKAGIIEEMMEDTFEGLDDQEELEEEAQKEVDKVLWELTAGQLGTAPAAVSESLPDTEAEGATASTSAVQDTDLADMQERLEALRS